MMDQNGRTKDLIYECIECNKQEIVKSSDHRQDGRVCKGCGGHLIAKGHVHTGIDMSIQEDETVYHVDCGKVEWVRDCDKANGRLHQTRIY